MIVDSSALVALVQREGTAVRIAELLSTGPCRIGAPTWTETLIVMTHRYGPVGRTILERLRHEFALAVIDYTAEHAAIAVDAFARFGRGRHKAALNFGDCMTYATAKFANVPLLAVGDDFAHTDLVFVQDGIVGRWAEPG